jgi:hypothetical protein
MICLWEFCQALSPNRSILTYNQVWKKFLFMLFHSTNPFSESQMPHYVEVEAPHTKPLCKCVFFWGSVCVINVFYNLSLELCSSGSMTTCWNTHSCSVFIGSTICHFWIGMLFSGSNTSFIPYPPWFLFQNMFLVTAVCMCLFICSYFPDIVNCDLKSALMVLYNLFTRYRNVDWICGVVGTHFTGKYSIAIFTIACF